ncbi:hypothetical protein WA538_001061 [Blastocystis sp. DL]
MYLLIAVVTAICSCSEIVCFKIYLDRTRANGAVFIPIVYFLIHLLISKLSYEYQKHSNRHSLEYTEYTVPDLCPFIIGLIGATYYIMICLMTPHLQSTHLVVLMQSSCVFTGIFMYTFHLISWTWQRTCQLLLGLTSLVLMLLSLFLNRRTCCIVIILATLLFLLCVLLNAYMTAFTADTLLRFVSLFLPSHRQPSMQSQFEFHIYKHEAAAALPLLFLLFALRDPNRVQFVDLFTFLRSIVDGFLATCRSAVSPLVRPHVQNWLWLLGYLLAGVGFDVAYAWLVRYSNAVFSSFVQVVAFVATLAIMWVYEELYDVPTHDPLTVVSFVLFSLLLFWDGVGLPVFQTHNASFFENKHDMSTPRPEDPVPFRVCLDTWLCIWWDYIT